MPPPRFTATLSVFATEPIEPVSAVKVTTVPRILISLSLLALTIDPLEPGRKRVE
jgi:hypothetical protein